MNDRADASPCLPAHRLATLARDAHYGLGHRIERRSLGHDHTCPAGSVGTAQQEHDQRNQPGEAKQLMAGPPGAGSARCRAKPLGPGQVRVGPHQASRLTTSLSAAALSRVSPGTYSRGMISRVPCARFSWLRKAGL